MHRVLELLAAAGDERLAETEGWEAQDGDQSDELEPRDEPTFHDAESQPEDELVLLETDDDVTLAGDDNSHTGGDPTIHDTDEDVIVTESDLHPACEFSINADNVVTIYGGSLADKITVTDHLTGLVTIDIQCGNGQHQPWLHPQGVVQKIIFHGGWGDDEFRNYSEIPSEAYGDRGDDILIGGAASDELHGNSGDDYLKANGWFFQMLWVSDRLYGDGDDDVLIGSVGDDVLMGGTGDDIMSGSAGNDQMFGGRGWDQLFGDAGNDYLQGGYDNITDELTGGSGSDTFVYEWRENLGNGVWVPKDSENVNDFALGDTLEWKEVPQ